MTAASLPLPGQKGPKGHKGPKGLKEEQSTRHSPLLPFSPSPFLPFSLSPRLSFALITGVGLLAYANSLHTPFIFDDEPNIIQNSDIRSLWPPWHALFGEFNITRPVVSLSLAVNYALGGLNPLGYHIVNLLLHILAALTLFGVCRRTFNGPVLKDRYGPSAATLALAAALLWVAHPLATSAVTYVIQRAEVLMALFYLLTLYCFIRGAASARRGAWWTLAVAACALGMLSKQVMVSAPLVVWLYDRTFVSGSFLAAARRHWRVLLPLAATAALIPLTLLLAPNPPEMVLSTAGFPVWQYLQIEAGAVLHYLSLALAPWGQSLDYSWPAALVARLMLPGAVLVPALLAAAVWALRRRPALGFLGAGFFALLAPTSSFVPFADPVFEHRMYLPLAVVLVAVLLGVYALGRRRALFRPVRIGGKTLAPGWVLAGLVVLLSIALTLRRNYAYRSARAIWEDAVAQVPENARAHCCLGQALAADDDLERAGAEYTEAVRLKPDYAEAYHFRGQAYGRRGLLSRAVDDFTESLKWRPDVAESYRSRGELYARMERPVEALRDYERAVAAYTAALARRPGQARLYYERGFLYEQLADYQHARADLARAADLDQDRVEAWTELGQVCRQLRDYAPALAAYTKALALAPANAALYNARGIAFQQAGRYPEALADYNHALALKPDDAHFLINRAMAHFFLKDFSAAWADVQASRRLGGVPPPEFIEKLEDNRRGEREKGRKGE